METNTILEKSKSIGDINYFKNNERFIIFITTKNKNKQSATYENIYITLINLKQFCLINAINKLAMNKIGQRDNLEWEKIRAMIRYIFRESKIEIIICGNLDFSKEEKLIIFKQFHDSKFGGHLGINKTIKRIKKQFYWKGMKDEVKAYIKNCESCQKNKITNKHVQQPMIITTSSRPFEKVFLDIVGPLVTTLSGNTYILTIQDDLTKYSLGVPLPNHQANTVAEAFVTQFVCMHGIPETILTDQETGFFSKIFIKVKKKKVIINNLNKRHFNS